MASRILVRLLVGVTLFSIADCLPAYSNLHATSDGAAVFVEVPTSFRHTAWYRVRRESNKLIVDQDREGIADISDDASTIATSVFGERFCGVSGSSCFLSPPCNAGFTVEGPNSRASGSGRKTFLRLNGRGNLAWIEQSTDCLSEFEQPQPRLNGLYELPGIQLVAGSDGAVAANQRTGRRIITQTGKVLTIGGEQRGRLRLRGREGALRIRHQFAAYEAVVDAEGHNVVYLNAPIGRLRWVDVENRLDEDLSVPPAIGSAPALADDGRLLAYLSPEQQICLYDRATRTVRSLPSDPGAVSGFVLTGDGVFIFAVTSENQLIRIRVSSGESEVWLDTFPEISSVSADIGSDPSSCPRYCYSPPDALISIGRTALVVMHGKYFANPGWRVQLGDTSRPLEPLSPEAAWFQVPSDQPLGWPQQLAVYNPDHPLRFSFRAQVSQQSAACFGALHENFEGLVSEESPARVGEVISVFLTGFQGVEEIPDGIPNPTDRLIPVADPPELLNGDLVEPLFFGLAPGYIGLQQLNLRILRHVPRSPETPAPLLFSLYFFPQSNCELPSTAPN